MRGKKTYTLYILENKVNGKRYVGQTTGRLAKRLSNHQRGDESAISKAIQKYGIENFDITSFTAPNIEALNNIEIALIENLESLASKNGYNIREGGRNASVTADEKARLRDIWDDEKRGRHSRKLKHTWVKKRGRCMVCGKDNEMGYDPELDFRLCPSCRHTRHLSQDLGLCCLESF